MDIRQAKEIVQTLSTGTLRAWTGVYAVESFIIVFVNSLSLYTFIKTPSLKTRKHMMVVNLAVADLIFGALGISSLIYLIFKPTITSIYVLNASYTFPKAACLFTLGVIAVERMHAVVWPLRHKVMSGRVHKIALVGIWILSGIVAALELYNTDAFGESVRFVFFLPITIFGVISITIVCYVCIWIKVKRRRQSVHGAATRKDKSLVHTLLLITGVFVLMWALPITYFSASKICDSCYKITYPLLFHLFNALLALQSFLNPIIYCFRLPMFRMSLKARLREMKHSVCFLQRLSLESRKKGTRTELPTSVVRENHGSLEVVWTRVRAIKFGAWSGSQYKRRCKCVSWLTSHVEAFLSKTRWQIDARALLAVSVGRYRSTSGHLFIETIEQGDNIKYFEFLKNVRLF